MASILDLMGHVQQQGEIGRQRGTESRLARLAGQAYAAPRDQRDSFVQQAVATDPRAGFALQDKLQSNDDDRIGQLSQKARLFVGLAKSGNSQAIQSMYPQLAREASQTFGMQIPEVYDEKMLPHLEQLAALSGGQADGRVQSTYIDAQGNRVAIMADGSTQVLGQNAPNNQIIDTGNGFYGVNKGTLSAAPVNVGGGQPQGPQAPIPGVYIDPSLPPEVQEQIRQSELAGQPVPDQMYFGGGQQLRSVPKPQAAPAGYRDDGQGGLTPIPGGPAQVAIDARADAAEAKRLAEEAKAAQKQQASDARQAAAIESANGLINAIDSLTGSAGFDSLGTAWGDMQINTPLVRNDAKDAQAQLRNISGQVALNAMSQLRALSSQGATGFGALSAPELKLLENSIAYLQSDDISNAQLRTSLKTIRDKLEKANSWKPPQGAQQAAAPAPEASGGWSIQRVD